MRFVDFPPTLGPFFFVISLTFPVATQVECRWHAFQADEQALDAIKSSNSSHAATEGSAGKQAELGAREQLNGPLGSGSKAIPSTQLADSREELELSWTTDLNPSLLKVAAVLNFPRLKVGDSATFMFVHLVRLLPAVPIYL